MHLQMQGHAHVFTHLNAYFLGLCMCVCMFNFEMIIVTLMREFKSLYCLAKIIFLNFVIQVLK